MSHPAQRRLFVLILILIAACSSSPSAPAGPAGSKPSASGAPAGPPPAAPTPSGQPRMQLKIGFANVTAVHAALWTAHEGGAFARNGRDGELTNHGTSQST